ncbi:hypothetical protein M422DRAFT_271591 [Sphaerobolus stellatus SS14]|uniref:Uncharacterized protein n=1 Tax=Sphaerobolus stellatus (strain SS14) TaxID=990650 RepID=A0A0C9UPJ5_SPHS4|nr:hypothetical protein M422DRAFT_271591 [Sphaerobolus stellatus SS14]
MKYLNPSAPFQGKGRWAIPPFMLQSTLFIDKVAEMGISLQERLKMNRELNIQVEYSTFKNNILQMAKSQATKKACALNTIIAQKSKKLNETTMNPLIPEEEKQLVMAFLREDIRDLERKLHEKKRANVRARNILEGETVSKYWFEINKERTPRDPIIALRDPLKPPNTPLERNSKKMAEIGRNYHESLQTSGIVDIEPPEERSECILRTLDALSATVDTENNTGTTSIIDPLEVLESIKTLPNGTAAGLDGIPYELWKTLMQKHKRDSAKDLPAFDVVQLLTSLFNDIELVGISDSTHFNQGWMCPLYKKGDYFYPAS